MSNITLPRATVEQVLETIEGLTSDRLFTAEWAGKHGATITALRAALAQQDEPLNLRDPAVQKRLATQWGYVPAAQAEPVEPVAWIESPHGAIRSNPNHKFTFPSQLLHWQIPLYTSPPQRKPLTEEKKRALADKFLSCQPESYEVSGVFDLISAVERAHGIKE